MLRPEGFAGDRLLGNRWAMAAVAAILVTDIVFVLWGRTGYLSLVVMSVAIVVCVLGVCAAAFMLFRPHDSTVGVTVNPKPVAVSAPQGSACRPRFSGYRECDD